MKSSGEDKGYLKIGDVAQLVGISASALRLWEKLGLIAPVRTESRYRLYTSDDVRLLKRAKFLRSTRGLNPAAVAHLLKGGGLARSLAKKPSGSFGGRLRKLRLERGLSLSEVAALAGMSAGFLSGLERNQMSGSVGTLRKLARFYNTNILAFFNPEQANPHLVRPGERKVLEPAKGVRMELLAWGSTLIEPHLFRIAPGAGSGEAYSHDGEEFLFVLRGGLEISLDGGESYQLKPGDSFCFESTTPHSWVNRGKSEALVLWINTPPTF